MISEYQAKQILKSEVKTLEMHRVGSSFRQTFDVELDEFIGLEFNERVWDMSAMVLREHLATDIYRDRTYSYWPSSTWQMFKRTHEKAWWMRWFVKRYPVDEVNDVQEVGIEVKRYASYPEADIPIHRLGRPIPYESITNLRDLR